MLFSEAFAQSPGAPASGGFSLDSLQQFLPLVLIFVVFYFLMIRPQQKKMKAHREMVRTLRRGDRVLLQSGIYGRIATAPAEAESDLTVEIADKVLVKVTRTAVAEVLEKTLPVAAAEQASREPTGKDKAGKAE
jgi:preprotein translocase subunit YajC